MTEPATNAVTDTFDICTASAVTCLQFSKPAAKSSYIVSRKTNVGWENDITEEGYTTFNRVDMSLVWRHFHSDSLQITNHFLHNLRQVFLATTEYQEVIDIADVTSASKRLLDEMVKSVQIHVREEL